MVYQYSTRALVDEQSCKGGKKHLNFDEYTNRSLRFQYHKMEEIAELVKEGEMPLESYTWMHKDAKLTEAEKNELINWADGIRRAVWRPNIQRIA